MAEDDFPNIDEFDPGQIDTQAINAFHLGGNRFSASFELDDEDLEASRGYLLDVEFGASLTYRQRLRFEESLRDHCIAGAGQYLVLELGGVLHHLDSEGERQVNLPDGVLTRLWRAPDGRFICFGEGGVAYVGGISGWQRIPNVTDELLADTHGRSADAIHCAGWHGTLLRLGRAGWQPIETGTHDQFDAVHVAADGAIMLGGEKGVAYSLRDDELTALDAEPWDYTAICEFKGRTYWADANFGISVQRGQRIEPLRELGQGFRLQASADCLVVSGWHEVFVFDGESWEGFEMGYDGNIFLRRLDMADYGG